jgi:hypothetical protein
MRMEPRLLLFAIVTTAALVACGGGNPMGPSAGGVKLQGVLLSSGSAASQSARVSAQSVSGDRVTIKVLETSATTTTSMNGTFELDGVPATGFTLEFSVNGTVLGTIQISPAEASSTIKIVVQVTVSSVALVDIDIENDTQGQNETDKNDTSSKACMIEGGRTGDHIELEGVIASGNADHFMLQVNGNRASSLVDVSAGGASLKCNGDTAGKKGGATDCKSSVASGAQVHVKGTLTSCSASAAAVTATEVMVQKN